MTHVYYYNRNFMFLTSDIFHNDAFLKLKESLENGEWNVDLNMSAIDVLRHPRFLEAYAWKLWGPPKTPLPAIKMETKEMIKMHGKPELVRLNREKKAVIAMLESPRKPEVCELCVTCAMDPPRK